ncbi:MAG TPA: phosphopyruvate hydratase [Alphaproteobacteria bacterium]|nr:phosphopyruvate hydratase [Alphaproteobacteria bacterium]
MTKIIRMAGRRVWDSRGRPTVEAEVTLASGAMGRAIAPAGASTGSGEAADLRDGGSAFGGYDVRRAVAGINGEIAAALRGRDAADQAEIDRSLIELDGTPNKARLGGNALIAVSLATAHAAAAARKMPLWQALGATAPRIPMPEIQIIGGGAHAGRRVDLQDFMAMPVGARDFAEALDWVAETYRAAGALFAEKGALRGVADEGGFWPEVDRNEEAIELVVRAIEKAGLKPGTQVALSLDIAATQLRQKDGYRLARDGRTLSRDALIDMLLGWLKAYPICAIEDPVAEDDVDGMTAFTRAADERAIVIGDDFLVTDAARIAASSAKGACSAALIKPNQAGTVTETKAAFDAARKAGWATIVSARSGESEDVTIAHLASGWGADVLKVGSFTRSERMAKWNECLRIAEAPGAVFAGWRFTSSNTRRGA